MSLARAWVLVVAAGFAGSARANGQGGEEALLERLVLAEANGEGRLGKALVARSVMNRAALIQRGAVGPGTYLARSGSLGDVIRGSGQYQPLRDGRIDLPWSAAQRAEARQAIDLARDTAQLRRRLLASGVSPGEADRLLDATGFRTPGAFADSSQAVGQQRHGGHVFNGAGGQGRDVRGAFQKAFGGGARPRASEGDYTSPLFPERGFATLQDIDGEVQRLFAAAEAQGSDFSNNRPFYFEGEKYGWAKLLGQPTPVLWGSVAGTGEGLGPAGGAPPDGDAGAVRLTLQDGGTVQGTLEGEGESETHYRVRQADGRLLQVPRDEVASVSPVDANGAPVGKLGGGRGRVNYQGVRVSSAPVRGFLQRLAELTGRTVIVTSGDRDYVPMGGSNKSLHLHRRAADFVVDGMSLGQAWAVIRSHRAALLAGGSYELIWHQPGTRTSAPHLHVGDYGDGRGTVFKIDDGTYRVVP